MVSDEKIAKLIAYFEALEGWPCRVSVGKMAGIVAALRELAELRAFLRGVNRAE